MVNMILLWGPAGTGKSALVEAMAAAHNRRIIWLNPNVLSKYVGDTEA